MGEWRCVMALLRSGAAAAGRSAMQRPACLIRSLPHCSSRFAGITRRSQANTTSRRPAWLGTQARRTQPLLPAAAAARRRCCPPPPPPPPPPRVCVSALPQRPAPPPPPSLADSRCFIAKPASLAAPRCSHLNRLARPHHHGGAPAIGRAHAAECPLLRESLHCARAAAWLLLRGASWLCGWSAEARVATAVFQQLREMGPYGWVENNVADSNDQSLAFKEASRAADHPLTFPSATSSTRRV